MSEAPNTVHGRLLEAVHISGYSFERACSELEWLLEEDRWREVAGGFADINAFLATIDLSEFRVAVDQRKGLARKLKALQASQRATAKAIGVAHETIRRDVTDVPLALATAATDAKPQESPATDVTPPEWFQGDVDPAKLAKGRSARKQRDRDAEQRRIEEAREQAEPVQLVGAPDIRQGDFREALADLRDIDAIITDPPYGREHLPLLADLAEWSGRVLAPDGILAVLFGQTHLPDVYRLLGGHRPYRWTACLLTEGPGYVSHAGRVQSGWKPVLIYGGGPRFADVVRSEGLDVAAKSHHVWAQDFAAFSTLVERLTSRSSLVADPFCGSGTTAVAAHALGRRFVGCDIDAAAVATTRERLAA